MRALRQRCSAGCISRQAAAHTLLHACTAAVRACTPGAPACDLGQRRRCRRRRSGRGWRGRGGGEGRGRRGSPLAPQTAPASSALAVALRCRRRLFDAAVGRVGLRVAVNVDGAHQELARRRGMQPTEEKQRQPRSAHRHTAHSSTHGAPLLACTVPGYREPTFRRDQNLSAGTSRLPHHNIYVAEPSEKEGKP